ncbi:MAG: glycosyltransferase [Candidatus Omnitrophica bacterium]|nr:glycosyltransferase [Candidatus Omnitrophota bacterium]
MYISEISGHHSASLAIENAIRKLSPDSEIMNLNAFNYTNPISEKIVNRLYMSVIKRTPRVWDYLYDNPRVAKNINKMKDTIHKFNSPKLKKLFERFKPDIVLCTQAFPCGMVADFKRTYNSNIPLIAVLTDYIPHAYWVYDTINYFITPSEEISQRLINKGVTIDRIKPLGIPFNYQFNTNISKEKIMQEIGLNPKVPTIMLMGGGQGLGPIKAIVKSLEKVNGELQEIVVAGTNRKLYNSLKRKIKKLKKKVLLFGYTNRINELMSISDIIVTKPGGVTTAEVLARRIPMIIVKPLPGQEANNTTYLTQKGAAIKIDNPSNINLVIERLLANPEKLRIISESAGNISKPNASMDIAKLVLNI